MPQPDISLVRDFAVFRNIGEADLAALLQAAQTRRIPKKAAVFTQGARAEEFFVLLHGHLKVVQTTDDGQQVIVRIVEPGEIYGVAMVLGRPDYPGTAMAIEDSITLVWPASAWPRLVERIPALAVNVLQTVDSACRKRISGYRSSRPRRSSGGSRICSCASSRQAAGAPPTSGTWSFP